MRSVSRRAAEGAEGAEKPEFARMEDGSAVFPPSSILVFSATLRETQQFVIFFPLKIAIFLTTELQIKN